MRIKLLLIINFLLVSVLAYSQTSGIKGVVTYYFNEYQGDKPDLGAKVYAIESSNPNFDPLLMDTFVVVKSNRNLFLRYEKMALDYLVLAKPYEKRKRDKEKYDEYMKKAKEMEHDGSKYKDVLNKYGIDTDEKFEQLCKRVSNQHYVLYYKNIPTASVDGVGNYSINLKPQTYYIIIISKNRRGLNSAEILGKLHYEKVTINDGEVKSISTNFDLY